MLKIVLAVLLVTTPLANAQNVWGDEKEKIETAVENFAENMEEKVGTWQVQDVEKLHDEG